MFASVFDAIADRRLSSQRTVALIKTLEETYQTPVASAWKGLAFVQLYATYEYAVRSGVQATLVAVRGSGVEIRALRRDLLALVLDANWESVSMSGRPRVWGSRMALIAKMDSIDSSATLRDDLFPTDGSHYRISQLQTIWRIFSIDAPIVPEPRLMGRIEELVENRNAISHGRHTPEEVGGRYSWQDISARVVDTDAICGHLVGTLDAHVRSGGLLTERVGR